MLHVLVGKTCNNNCLFCMEDDRDGRAAHIAKQSPRDVHQMIVDYPHDDEILFTSGEPTLCPELLQYVGWARERGFRVIGLISNGRRLAYRSFLQDLVVRGLNRITISIHGHTARLQDGMTRAPGSFLQTCAGLERCARLKRSTNLRVHTSTVLTQRNLMHVPSIHAMLRGLEVDQMIWNVMMAKGRGARHFESLMPRYDAVVRVFRRLCATLDDQSVRRIRVVDMPPCVLQQLPAGIGGESEEFDQYEPTGSTGIAGLEILNPASVKAARDEPHGIRGRARLLTQRFGRGGFRAWFASGGRQREVTEFLQAFDQAGGRRQTMDSFRKTMSRPALVEDRDYYVTRRSLKDRFLRVKGPPCRSCRARAACPGVWELYADQFGWSEFEPID